MSDKLKAVIILLLASLIAGHTHAEELRSAPTRAEALSAAIKESLDLYYAAMQARYSNREYGTVLLRCGDTYRYLEPNAGKEYGAWEVRLTLPQGCVVDSIIHTHPADSYGYAGLSPHDKEVVKSLRGVASYVITAGQRRGDVPQIHEMRPNGTLWVDGQPDRRRRR